jgi:hypothetical protein
MDRRELILERIAEILGGVAGIVTVTRNKTEFDDTQMPAAGVLEGDEDASDSDARSTRPSARPYLVTARPQIWLRADGDNVGTTLNNLRAAIIKAVLEDTELNALSANGRGVRYDGQQTTLHAARSMVGATALMFAITYLLDPTEL